MLPPIYWIIIHFRTNFISSVSRLQWLHLLTQAVKKQMSLHSTKLLLFRQLHDNINAVWIIWKEWQWHLILGHYSFNLYLLYRKIQLQSDFCLSKPLQVYVLDQALYHQREFGLLSVSPQNRGLRKSLKDKHSQL